MMVGTPILENCSILLLSANVSVGHSTGNTAEVPSARIRSASLGPLLKNTEHMNRFRIIQV